MNDVDDELKKNIINKSKASLIFLVESQQCRAGRAKLCWILKYDG